MVSRELSTFLKSAVVLATTFLTFHQTDWFWLLQEPQSPEPAQLLRTWIIQVAIPSSLFLLTQVFLYWRRGPLSPAEQKVQNILLPRARFNLLVTLPVSRAVCLALGAYINTNRGFVLRKFARAILIEMLHHTMHSAGHVKGWVGWRLHQLHHIKDYSLPLSAMGNHPIDLFATVFGVIACIDMYSNSDSLDQIRTLLFISLFGTLVHSDSHFIWQLDIHGQHHSDGRYNLNGYFPVTDLLVGTFKHAQPYTKPYGWR